MQKQIQTAIAAIDDQIQELTYAKQVLEGLLRVPLMKSASVKAAPVKTRKQHDLSPQARKRIAEAQRKRWAEWRTAKANGAIPKSSTQQSGALN